MAFSAAQAAAGSPDVPQKPPVSLDPGLKQPLATATSLIGRGQFAEALHFLRFVLGGPENKLVLLDGRYVDAKIEANRLIAGLPDEARALYEREFGDVARRELQRAQASGRMDQILAVAGAYRHTEAGRQALSIAAGLFLDGGQFVEAAAAAAELLEAAAPRDLESSAAARLVTAWLKLDLADRAEEWVEGRRAFLSSHEIEVHGTKHRLDQWLSDEIHQHKSAATAPQYKVSGGHPQRVGPGRFRRPSSRPIWNKRTNATGVLAKLAEDLITQRVESGIPPVFQSFPLVVGPLLVVRRGDQLAGFDLNSAQERWSINVSPRRVNDCYTLADRAFAGAPQSALSTDGQRVFTVIEDKASYARPVFVGRGRRMIVEVPAKNSLAAYDLSTGKTLWRLGEVDAQAFASRPEEGNRDIDFAGPPLVLGGILYVLGRTDDGPNLLALDPEDGKVRWGESLAGFSRFEAESTSALGPACVPVYSDGLLICPTPQGIVIAIDLATRTCRWAYRAQPTEEPAQMMGRWGRRFPLLETQWMNDWRENLIRVDGRRCYFVSPRSNAIHALATDSGRLLWTKTISDPLFLGPVVGGRLLAVSQYRALAFDAATGAPIWNSPIGLPSGRGFAVKERYLLPQAAGGLAAIDLRTGSVDFPLHPQMGDDVSPPMAVLGNLVPLAADSGPAAVSQSHDEVAILAALDSLRGQSGERLSHNPADADTLRDAARLDLEAGDFEKAERRFAQLIQLHSRDSSKKRKAAEPDQKSEMKSGTDAPQDDGEEEAAEDRRELFETLVAEVARNPNRVGGGGVQLLLAADGDEQRAIALRTLGGALRGRGERTTGLDAYLQLARLELPVRIELDEGPRRVVAFDRQLQAELQDLLQACSPQEGREGRSRIGRALDRVFREGDLVRLGRMYRRLRGTGLDRGLCRKIEASLRPLADLESHMLLWESAGSGESSREALAWRELAELYRSRGDPRSAASCYRRLLADYAAVRFDDGLGAAELVSAARADRPLLREIEEVGSDPWPQEAPDASADADAGSSAQFFQLPLQIAPGSLFERLDVALDHQGETLRFQGNFHPTSWEVRLPLESSRFRSLVPLHRGWGVGQVVVVQVGSDLVGVLPLDEKGRPDARLLWHVDLLGSLASSTAGDLDVRFAPAAPGAAGQHIWLTDRLGRPVARVGPVTAGYVCYQDRSTLIALDPASGRLLWKRTDIPAADVTSGDPSSIILIDRRTKRLQVLRALDGKTLDDRNLAPAAEIRWLEGLDAATQTSKGHHTTIARINVISGQVKWTRSYNGETQVARLDSRLYAAVEPDGSLHVLDSARGEVVTSCRVAGAERCLQLHVAGDESRFYLAFSTAFGESRAFRANGQRDDSRNPSVNGVLCALDRRSGRVLWSRPFVDAAFALDQSRVAPMLVFYYRQYRHAGNDDGLEIAWPVLHCVDKRTGRDVFNERLGSALQPFVRPFAETELGRHEVVVRCSDSAIRFRYSH